MNPGTTIEIGNFPKPTGPGNHCIRYDTAAEQYSSIHSYMDATFTSSTYVRPERGWFDIDAYAPSIKYANYGMFDNPDDRRYYFDITSVEYVNENVTRVHFSIDLLATYMFDYARTSQRVLREHVNDDSVGANIQPEPVGTGELTVDWQTRTSSSQDGMGQSSYDFDLREPCIFIFAGDQSDGNKVYAGVLDGTVEGACCWAAPLAIQENGEYFTGGFTDWLWSMNRNNKAESIVAMTNFPLALANIPQSGLYDVTPLFGDSGEHFTTKRISFHVHDIPTTVDGYTPRNNKLLTYPYCFMRATNYKGQYRDYRYEFFGPAAEYSAPAFQIKGSPDPAGDIWAIPINYNGAAAENPEFAITMGGIPQVSWPFNSYENWLAGNAGSLAMNLLSTAAMFIPGVGIGVKVASAAGKALAVGNTTRSFLSAAGTGASMARGVAVDAARASMRQSWAEIPGLAKGAAALAAGQGVSSAGNLAATLYDQSNVPDGVRGQTTSAATAGVGAYGFSFMGMCVREDFAKSIDDFFQVYGYAVNENKVPNETGRKSYNFVQTQGAAFRANSNALNTMGVPASAMAAINAMYDEGIWFWHDPATAGDFTDDNPIV